MIDSYSFGRMVIEGREYRKDLLILPDGRIVCPWWRISGHELAPADLREVVAAGPRLLVVGTGADGVMKPAPDLLENLEAGGIRVVLLPTGPAVERYNSLLGKEAGLAACFHLTC
jgi:hypothetical protein